MDLSLGFSGTEQSSCETDALVNLLASAAPVWVALATPDGGLIGGHYRMFSGQSDGRFGLRAVFFVRHLYEDNRHRKVYGWHGRQWDS